VSTDIDTSLTRTYRQSPARVLLLIVGSLAFVIGGIAMLTQVKDYADFGAFIAIVAILFFGACAALGAYRLIALRGDVVTISPDGLRDLRVAARLIPWTAVENISTWSYRGQEVMVLAVNPAIAPTLELTRIARWSRGANAALGANGLCITATGLKVSHDELISTSIAYAKAAQTHHAPG
jgi:hypothetical protein